MLSTSARVPYAEEEIYTFIDSILPGNSGGPIVDGNGRAIGIFSFLSYVLRFCYFYKRCIVLFTALAQGNQNLWAPVNVQGNKCTILQDCSLEYGVLQNGIALPLPAVTRKIRSSLQR